MSDSEGIPPAGAGIEDQLGLPGISAPAPNNIGPYVLLTDLEIQAARRALIDAEGDMDKAGISLDHMRNIIYTCRMKVNPMTEAEQAEKVPKKTKTKSTNVQTTLDVNSLMG